MDSGLLIPSLLWIWGPGHWKCALHCVYTRSLASVGSVYPAEVQQCHTLSQLHCNNWKGSNLWYSWWPISQHLSEACKCISWVKTFTEWHLHAVVACSLIVDHNLANWSKEASGEANCELKKKRCVSKCLRLSPSLLVVCCTLVRWRKVLHLAQNQTRACVEVFTACLCCIEWEVCRSVFINKVLSGTHILSGWHYWL